MHLDEERTGEGDRKGPLARLQRDFLLLVARVQVELAADFLDGLEARYNECITEKNSTLIRYDIVQSLRNLYDAVGDEAIREKALELIEMEDDLKYRKKYAGAWRVK